jgi:hypothetical protein
MEMGAYREIEKICQEFPKLVHGFNLIPSLLADFARYQELANEIGLKCFPKSYEELADEKCVDIQKIVESVDILVGAGFIVIINGFDQISGNPIKLYQADIDKIKCLINKNIENERISYMADHQQSSDSASRYYVDCMFCNK